jgi:predicted DNA-binding transcriptional regulator AlpA
MNSEVLARTTTDGGRDLWAVQALNTKQAATYTGLSVATLEKLRCYGGGPRFVSYSRRAVRYRIADLEEWMADRTVANTSQTKAA